MAQMNVQDRITTLAESICASLGFELVEVEYTRSGRSMVLRVFMDKPGGVTLDDCSELSRELSQILDVEDIIREHYTLEVSSPGLDRPLKREDDYRRYAGRIVKIRTYEVLTDEAGNRRKTFVGTLLGLEDEVVRLKLSEGQPASIPLGKIAKANLEFEF
jgi:ribosome maturation factor RimP